MSDVTSPADTATPPGDEFPVARVETKPTGVRSVLLGSRMWWIALAAIALAGYLTWRSMGEEGPTITVDFPEGHGLEVGDAIRHRGIDVGHDQVDPALRARAEPQPDGSYRLNGSKAWVTHGGEADYYTLFARSGDKTISCFLVPGDAEGLSPQKPEHKMGLMGSTTSALDLDDLQLDRDRLIGEPGSGLKIALQALDSGRLGIAAVALGVAQAALDHAVEYAGERTTFGKPIIEHQGLAFMLADMAAAIEPARAIMLEAARLRDRGLPFSRQAAVAKLTATDAAMKVTTDAVQVLGGYGYTKDFPVERLMREAKVMQIFEGTNQIQRLIIARHLAGARR